MSDYEGPFTLQINSFKESSNAERLKIALENKYNDVYIAEADFDNNKYYRVRIGKFNSLDEAYLIAEALNNEGYSVLISKYDEE
ncbi:MAG: SPOR domain-containing protein [Nitrospirota bacterium]